MSALTTVRVIGFLLLVVGGFAVVKSSARVNLTGATFTDVRGRAARFIGAVLVVAGLALIVWG